MTTGGRWEELRPQIWETVVRPCACCGQVVAKRLWMVEIAGASLGFCSLDCEALYREYVMGRKALSE